MLAAIAPQTGHVSRWAGGISMGWDSLTRKMPCFLQQINKERLCLAISPGEKSPMGSLPEGSRSNGLLLSGLIHMTPNGKLFVSSLCQIVSFLQADHPSLRHRTWHTAEFSVPWRWLCVCCSFWVWHLLSLLLSPISYWCHVDLCSYNKDDVQYIWILIMCQAVYLTLFVHNFIACIIWGVI